MRQRSTISPSGAYISIFVWLAYFRCFRSTNGFQNNYNGGTHTVAKTLFLQRSLVALSVIASDMDDDYTFPDNVIDALDLVPLLQGVGRHTGTRRGHQALLSLVKEDQVTVTRKLLGQTKAPSSSRRWRAERTIRYQKQQPKSKRPPLVPIAKSSEEARQEYQLVEAATLALSENVWNLTYPPFYGTESNPGDTSTIEETDNDEWLMLPADAWSLEHILQAEQVIDTLLQTQRWANREEMQTWMPELSKIGAMIDPESILPSILEEIAGRVEIVRVRTLLDSSAKASYYFRLRPDTYPVLKLLRDKEDRILKAGGKEFDSEVLALQIEIESVESQIRGGLAQLVLGATDVIDAGLDVLARLDVIFAKAAFGQKMNGAFPWISKEGTIAVDRFVHPVLALSDGFATVARKGQPGYVMPIDLRLSSKNGQRALLISGPNGGGKTLSMKSFGLVCILTKIAIPISVANDAARPRVDFVDNIMINVGDKQNVIHGESTWTSLMNSCAKMLETVRSNQKKSHLVLLDELGSGTDPEAGGAVAQAILEEFMTVSGCHIVATTHSPRLKTLSYETENFACATVLLEMDGSEQYKKPTFRLAYGIIGESYALGAASRSQPSLPESVLSRASELMAEEATTSSRRDYIQALTSSMEVQLKLMVEERMEAERYSHESLLCRQAMLSLAASYETHLDRLQQRLDDCYCRLRDDHDKSDVEVIGDTIAQIKLAKKQIKSQQELLREKGLKLLPTSYVLSLGESVVIVSGNSEWDGVTVQVVADATTDSTLTATEVLVRRSSSFLAWGPTEEINAKQDYPWLVQRHELAIWDYDSMWEEENYEDALVKATSVPNSKQRLNSILSTLKSDTLVGPDSRGPVKGSKIKKSFLSARARRAASPNKKK